MSDITVQTSVPRSLIRLMSNFIKAKDDALKLVEAVLIAEVKTSVKERAYDTGALFRSIETRAKKFVTFQTIEVFSTLLYAGFIERGTRFMKARRPFALGMIEAKKKIEVAFNKVFRNFLDN